eukprot:COSAG02_NODE_4108_length_5768_cov_66.257717_2_plen_50_part_00
MNFVQMRARYSTGTMIVRYAYMYRYYMYEIVPVGTHSMNGTNTRTMQYS